MRLETQIAPCNVAKASVYSYGIYVHSTDLRDSILPPQTSASDLTVRSYHITYLLGGGVFIFYEIFHSVGIVHQLECPTDTNCLHSAFLPAASINY